MARKDQRTGPDLGPEGAKLFSTRNIKHYSIGSIITLALVIGIFTVISASLGFSTKLGINGLEMSNTQSISIEDFEQVKTELANISSDLNTLRAEISKILKALDKHVTNEKLHESPELKLQRIRNVNDREIAPVLNEIKNTLADIKEDVREIRNSR